MCLSRFLAVGLLLLGISASPPATPLAREAHSVTGDAGGQVVSDWGALASQLATATRMPPFRTPVTFALVHLAMYDAVNAVAGGYKPYASSPRVALPASGVAAAVGAAYTILLTEFPPNKCHSTRPARPRSPAFPTMELR